MAGDLANNQESGWTELGRAVLETLTDARLQLHWSSQVVASVGVSFITPRPDDSHPNLEWLSGPRLLAGNLTEHAPRFRAAIQPATLTLHLLDEGTRSQAELSLAGRTLDEAHRWLAEAIAAFTGGEVRGPLTRPAYDIPAHPVGEGASFSAPAEDLREIERWYANADATLRSLQASIPRASPVRCWPHHFDIALLVKLDEEAGSEHARTIGVGMTPGDGSYAAPYWYVNPWPRPDPGALPPLQGPGHWHTEGWVGVVLTGPELVAAGGGASQVHTVRLYLDSALAACRAVLGDS